MSLELYNTTDRVRIVPKYRYNGKYTLSPYQTVDIESFAAKFFEPWVRIGVVVRVKVEGEEEQKAQVGEVAVAEEVIPEGVAEEPVVEETVETTETPKAKYTEKDLQEKTLKELKDIAAEEGIELADSRKRVDVIDAIVAHYSV